MYDQERIKKEGYTSYIEVSDEKKLLWTVPVPSFITNEFVYWGRTPFERERSRNDYKKRVIRSTLLKIIFQKQIVESALNQENKSYYLSFFVLNNYKYKYQNECVGGTLQWTKKFRITNFLTWRNVAKSYVAFRPAKRVFHAIHANGRTSSNMYDSLTCDGNFVIPEIKGWLNIIQFNKLLKMKGRGPKAAGYYSPCFKKEFLKDCFKSSTTLNI